MKVAIMQPYIFPYIGYWQLMNAVDKFIILDDVNFIVRGYINRNNILINGKVHLFTIPLDKPSQNKLIKEISMRFGIKEREDFLKMLSHAYSKAPFWKEGYGIAQKCILYNTSDLTEFIQNSIRILAEYLGIKAEILLSSDIEKNNSLKAEERIIELCKKTEADEYINASGGRELYSRENFRKENLELYFLDPDYEEIRYKQFKSEFIPNLSILDVIMFNDKTTIRELLSSCSLNK